MQKQHLIGMLIIIIIAVPIAVFVYLNGRSSNSSLPVQYSYRIVNTYPHDKNAFTEGLVFDNGFLFESTGLNGNSTLRRVELKTGRVVQLYALPNQFFGEGITVFNCTIIQLTWQSHKGFVYDKDTFALLRDFNYPTEGWGLTFDGSRLIMSDGTANLYFLDPQTFEGIGQVEVHDGAVPVTNLNELEYIHGDIYANVWLTNKIAIINPQNGQVKGWIDLTGLENQTFQNPDDVLNGIAYDAKNDRLLLTGKMWPHIFEIEVVNI